jgi:hypothetical protein
VPLLHHGPRSGVVSACQSDSGAAA